MGFTLSYRELDLVGEVLHTDVRVLPFDFPPCTESWSERLALAEEADAALAERGLAGDGWLAAELTHAVLTLATGRPTITADGAGPDGPIVARAAIAGRDAVTATQRGGGDTLAVALGSSAEVVGRMLALLPRHPPAPGASHTVRVERDGGHREEDFSRLTHLTGDVGTSYRERDERAVAAVFEHPEWGSGSFAVRANDRRGAETARMTVDWYDSEQGRWMSYSTFAEDGSEWRVYRPGTPRLIGNKLHELIEECAVLLPR